VLQLLDLCVYILLLISSMIQTICCIVSFLSLVAFYLNFYYTTPIIGVLHNNIINNSNNKNKQV